jgi:predicted esterase YcpF (UPF0227 family)
LSRPFILYLHGFTSGPQSFKSRALHAHLTRRGAGDRFVCPQLPASPKEAIALAETIIADKVSRGGTPTLIGSSLGGYYATWLAERHDLKAVLVNPAVVGKLSPELFVGPQKFLYTGEIFDFTPAHVAELRAIEVPVLSNPARFWLLAETGDEVLDYRDAVTRYAGARQTILEGGDHSFTRWNDYLDGIARFAAL